MEDLRLAVRWAVASPRAFANWPSALARVAASMIKRPSTDLVLKTRGGTTIACPNTGWARAAVFEVFAMDSYWLDEVIPSVLATDRSPTIVDIGAHVGSFTLACLDRVPDATVTCYEPAPKTFAYLSKNVTNHQHAHNVSLHQCAVGDSDKPVEVHQNAVASGTTFVTPAQATTASSALADAVSFEQVVERHGGKIDLLKVDCEGSEYRIILDSPVAAWRGIENVLLEYHPDPRHSWSDIALFLEDQGFDVRKHQIDAVGRGTVWSARRHG